MNGSIKVLHVDDEPALLDQAKIFLEKEEVKLDLTPAQTPKKTLELLEKEDFDVIVSDYQMPDMDGLEFLEEVKGKTVHEVWPETEEEWIERYGEVAVTGESQTFDLYHSPTDKMYHCNVYRPYETRDRFCVIFEDISEKEEREQKLRKERKKFQEIFNNANDAIYLYELTEEGMPGEFIEVNDVAEEMLGYNRKEFLQMSPPDIDAQEKADEILEIAKELVDRGEMRFEMVHQTKDGTKIPVEIHSHVFELEGEKRVLSVARDITERKEAEEREEFLHSLLRHDVQNKTRLVKGYLDLLEEDVDLPDEAKDYIQKAEKVTKASEEIIEKVRKLNQIKEEDEIKEIDIDSVLDQVLTEHE
ncbi:MAG: PAS domain S-box protein, partial [Candidatus Natronoplasma sp.]